MPKRYSLNTLGSSAIMVISLLVIIGWWLKKPFWAPPSSSTVIAFWAAAANFAVGCALLLRHMRPRLASILGVAVATISALMLFEHWTGIDLHIDLASLHKWADDRNPDPGRMAPTTAIALLLSGVSLMLSPQHRFALRLRHGLAACVLTLGVIGIIATVSGIGEPLLDPTSPKIAQLFPLMALPTSICLTLSGLLLLLQMSSVPFSPRAQWPVPGELAAYAFVGAAVTVLVTVALLSYSTITGLQNRARQVDHSYLVQGTFDGALAHYESARGLLRRYLMRGDEADFLSLVPELDRAAAGFDEVLELTQNESVQHRMLLAVKEPFHRDIDTMQQIAERKHQGQPPEKDIELALLAQRSLQGTGLNARLREFTDYEGSMLAALRKSSQRSMHSGLLLVMGGNAVGFTILGFALWYLVYSLQQRAQLEDQLRATNETLESRIVERTSELSNANAQLELLNTTLEQRIRERTADLEDFSYSVSHDLRAPLRAIDGYSMMLHEDQAERLDDDGRRMLGQIRHYAQRMGHLIDDLLRMSQLGRQSLKKTMLDMTRLAEEVRVECSADAEKTGQKAAVVTVGSLHSVFADASLIRQVWINLISNALKYSSQVAQPQVWIASLVTETEVVYSIRDNGAGFDMAHADKLFGVFQRLHRNEEFSGTGVGLAIVDRIVRRHGGRVWAEGRLAEGATFYFTLPLTRNAHE